jgi:uncharacterized membrane protein
MKKILLLMSLILASQLASAAILHGTLYTATFNELNDVVVEVNSTPPQIFVSKEGQYSFVLEPGTYELTAKYRISGDNFLYSADNVTISRDGYFVKDLFLEPAKRVSAPTGAVVGPSTFSLISIGLVIAILVASLAYALLKLKNKPDANPETENKLVDFIKKEGGRTTQKDIRKQIPLSEAKISLMISELENDGIVKRIKKGRGNIIVLNKK